MKDRKYTSGDLTRLTGATRKALRLYQDHGLLPKAAKSARAKFDAQDLERLRLVLALREIGLSLEQIGQILQRRDELRGGPAAARPLGEDVDDLVKLLTDRIARLGRVREELIRTRETLLGCERCDEEAVACRACADSGALDPLARYLLVVDA